MSIKLKEETILDQWSIMFENAASLSNDYLEAIQGRLDQSEIPGNCTWRLEEIQAGGMFAKTKREFLVIEHDDFKDYRTYVAARPYGTLLDLCRFTTCEPGYFKKKLANTLGGTEQALSSPKNILLEQDLRAYMSVIHTACVKAAEDVASKSNIDLSNINRGSQGALKLWAA
jgi:hypothetical protein